MKIQTCCFCNLPDTRSYATKSLLLISSSVCLHTISFPCHQQLNSKYEAFVSF